MDYPEAESAESLKDLGVKTARRGSIFVSGKVVGALVSLALLVYLARVLRPADYGLYTIVISYSLVLGMGGNFGMGAAFRKMLPERIRDSEAMKKIIANGMFVSLSAAFAIAIAGIVVSPYVAAYVYHNSSISLPLMIAAASVFLTVFFNAAVSALIGMHKAVDSTIANLSYAVSQLLLVILFVSMGYGVLGAIAGYAASAAIGAIAALIYLAKSIGARLGKVEMAAISEITKFSMPVVASNVAMTGLMNFAPLLLGVYATATIVGNYGIALKGSRFIDLLVTSITFVLLPAFSTMLASKEMREKVEHAINSSIYYTFFLLLPIIAYMIGSAKPLVFLLFSHSYVYAPIYLSIALVGLAIEVIWGVASTLVIGHGNTRRFMQYQLTIVAIELAALLILTPLYKAYGALTAIFIISPAIATVLYSHLLRKEFGIKVSFGKPARIAVAAILLAIIMAAVSFYMKESYLVLVANLAIALIIYPGLAAAFGAISKKEIAFMAEASKGFGAVGKLSSAYLSYFRLFVVKEKVSA
ncbi:MAG: oligosaccharide flippase family protein [Candidatus Micrarchaeia archaeon]